MDGAMTVLERVSLASRTTLGVGGPARWLVKAREEAEILVLLTGVDETFEQTVHARTSYRADEIVWNARFRSVFQPQRPTSRVVAVDVGRLHEIEHL